MDVCGSGSKMVVENSAAERNSSLEFNSICGLCWVWQGHFQIPVDISGHIIVKDLYFYDCMRKESMK